MRIPHRLQGQKVKSQGGAGAYCGGHLAAQLVIFYRPLSGGSGLWLPGTIKRIFLTHGEPNVLTLIGTRSEDVEDQVLVVGQHYVALQHNSHIACRCGLVVKRWSRTT